MGCIKCRAEGAVGRIRTPCVGEQCIVWKRRKVKSSSISVAAMTDYKVFQERGCQERMQQDWESVDLRVWASLRTNGDDGEISQTELSKYVWSSSHVICISTDWVHQGAWNVEIAIECIHWSRETKCFVTNIWVELIWWEQFSVVGIEMMKGEASSFTVRKYVSMTSF